MMRLTVVNSGYLSSHPCICGHHQHHNHSFWHTRGLCTSAALTTHWRMVITTAYDGFLPGAWRVPVVQHAVVMLLASNTLRTSHTLMISCTSLDVRTPCSF
jgi:hypothetical protein